MAKKLLQTTLSKKGQIVIPAKLRKRLRLKSGTRFSLEEKNGQLILHPKTPEFYEQFLGVLEDPKLLEALQKSRRQEKLKERQKIGL